MSQALSQPFTPLTSFMSRRSLWSADLSWRQRVVLACVVVLAHGLLLWLVLRWPVKPLDFPAQPVIVAQLVSQPPRLKPSPQPAHVEPPPESREAQPLVPTREPVAQRRQAMDTPSPPPVLASPKPAQANEPVAPISETRAVQPAPVVAVPAAVRATKDVAGDAPAGVERGRSDSKDHTISPADYLIKPPNDYPSDAYDAGESGTVRFEVLIDESGRPEDFKIARSSGSPRLDRQARRNVMRARFKPRTENGQPWKGWLHGQMTFTAPD